MEHFDVYGKVQTSYSQVYWTRNTPINLPPELVERFDGKVMAITGYEVDQVTHSGEKNQETVVLEVRNSTCPCALHINLEEDQQCLPITLETNPNEMVNFTMQTWNFDHKTFSW